MLQKTDEEKENQNYDENKVYVLCNENERNFNYNNFFICFNFKRHCNLNKKNMKRKTNKSLKKRCFNKSAIFYQERKNNIN